MKTTSTLCVLLPALLILAFAAPATAQPPRRSVSVIGPATVCLNGPDVTYRRGGTTCGRGRTTWSVHGPVVIRSMDDSIATLRFTAAGRAYLVLTRIDACGAGSDTLAIDISAGPKVNLGPDRALCKLPAVLLDAGSGRSYRWENGLRTRLRLVTRPGIYWVEVSDGGGCPGRDTIQIFSGDPNPRVELGPDRSLCDSSRIVLDAGAGFTSYRWQDGSRGRTYVVTRPGTYAVCVTGSCGGVACDSVRVTGGSVWFDIPDTVVCRRDSIALTVPIDAEKYIWSTGESSRSIRVYEPGVFIVRAYRGGCQHTDTVRVIFQSGGFLTATVASVTPGIVAPGQRQAVRIALRLLTQSGQRPVGMPFYALLHLDAEPLMPLDSGSMGWVANGRRYLQVQGTVPNSDTLAVFTFLAGPTNQRYTDIVLDSFLIVDPCLAGIRHENGRVYYNRASGVPGDDPSLGTSPDLSVVEHSASAVVARYDVQAAGELRVALVDERGAVIGILREGFSEAGPGHITVDTRSLPSGMYFITLQSAGGNAVEKLVIGR